MKAIGGVQTVGATHFVDRASLLAFLDEMIVAEGGTCSSAKACGSRARSTAKIAAGHTPR